jgi:hypothetical protein
LPTWQDTTVEAEVSTETVKQHDEIVMDKELAAEHTDAIASTVELVTN